jgi:putative transposase
VPEGKIAFRLRHILVESCEHYRAEIIALEIMPKHMHLLVEVDPQFGIHRRIKNLKGYSSQVEKNFER